MENNLLDYQESLKHALSQRDEIEKTVKELLKRDIKNVIFAGCGGSLAIMFSCEYIMRQNSSIPAFAYNAGEFNKLCPKLLGKNSLLITASYSGTTPETNEAVQIAKEKGAATIGFTGKADSPLSKNVDYVFLNNAKTGATNANLIMLYEIIFSIMRELDGFEKYDAVMQALDTLPDNLAEVKKLAEEKAENFANEYKDETKFLTIGAGLSWGEAYAYAICILEEMQWLYAQPVHAGEYFHGPFEIVDENANLIILKGEDFGRPLVERVIDFSQKYTKRLVILDTKDYPLPGVDEEMRGYLTPFVLSAALDKYSEKLAEIRNHPLSIRRYMGKVPY
ncbi:MULTISPECIES: SIS domain-containing protein [Tepidanaerobacter]|uniref:SIS domain-containing protein n=1 Tax=Tepidanaerobacter TaxID=499228 RepID=UPI000B277065|nr:MULTISPECIES: SIS domain-containing protein [Tepidanaerobacter]GLI51418.1 fructosamine deglycase FrlB [Tepidanaerobacter syntrophicus]